MKKDCLSIKIQKSNETTELFLLNKDLFLTRREFVVSKEKTTYDTFGAAWILFFGKIPEHRVFLSIGNDWFALNQNFILFIPPFEIVEWKTLPGNYEWWAISSDIPLRQMPEISSIYNIPENFKINDLKNIQELITATPLYKVSKGSNPHIISHKIKKEIDNNFKEEIKIKSIINTLNVSYSTAHELFKSDFGFSPNEYLRRVRYFHSLDQISLRGKSVFEAGINAGLNTPSQIYRLYKDISDLNPNQYSWKNIQPESAPDYNSLF